MKEKLKELRQRAGFSQKYVALTLGVTPSVVSQWETGLKEPSKENLRKLSDLYGVPVSYIMNELTIGNFTAEENQLLMLYRKLNLTGQKRALETLQLFVHLPEYQEKDIEPSAM